MVFIVFSTINSLIAQLLYLVRDTKPPILFSPIFRPNFPQFELLKSLFSFSTAKIEKNSWENWGKQDWWFGGLVV